MGKIATKLSSQPIVFEDSEDRVPCMSPKSDAAITRMERWKYEAVRRAVLRAAISAGSRGATLADLVAEAPRHLSESEMAAIGSLQWHVTTVKLDLEARGELARVAGATPLRHVRAAPAAAA